MYLYYQLIIYIYIGIANNGNGSNQTTSMNENLGELCVSIIIIMIIYVATQRPVIFHFKNIHVRKCLCEPNNLNTYRFYSIQYV